MNHTMGRDEGIDSETETSGEDVRTNTHTLTSKHFVGQSYCCVEQFLCFYATYAANP